MKFERDKGVIKGLDIGKDRSDVFRIVPLDQPNGMIYYLDYVYGDASIKDSKLKSTPFEGITSFDIETDGIIAIFQKK